MEDESVEILLFQAIQAALAWVTEVKTVEIWNDQHNHEDKERPRLYPFVGVQIETNWLPEEGQVNDYDQNQQKGNTIIIIHYIYQQIATETNQWQAQRAIVHKIFRALNGLDDDQFTMLIRTGTPHEESHGRVSDIQIGFTTEVIELAYRNDDNEILQPGDFSVETQNDLIIDNDVVRTGSLDSDVEDPLTGEITFSRTSGSGQIAVADGSSGVINIGKSTDRNIKINIVFARGADNYSQELDVVCDGSSVELAEGEVNPYIEASPDLGLDWGVSIVDDIVKLAYTLSSTGTDGTLYYVYNKIL